MGIFRKVGEWLTEKSDRFIRGEGEGAGGYYGSREAEQAYGGMGQPVEGVENQDGEETPRKPLDPFGYGEGDYGGRVPYRSRYELEREAQQAAKRPEPQPQMQQPAMQQPPQAQQQGMYQQQAYAQPASNVVPFPGMQRSADGSVYAHVDVYCAFAQPPMSART